MRNRSTPGPANSETRNRSPGATKNSVNPTAPGGGATSDAEIGAHKRDGDLLGETGLKTLLNALRGITGPKALETLIWDLAKVTGDDQFQDDLSGVLIEVEGSPNS